MRVRLPAFPTMLRNHADGDVRVLWADTPDDEESEDAPPTHDDVADQMPLEERGQDRG